MLLEQYYFLLNNFLAALKASSFNSELLFPAIILCHQHTNLASQIRQL